MTIKNKGSKIMCFAGVSVLPDETVELNEKIVDKEAIEIFENLGLIEVVEDQKTKKDGGEAVEEQAKPKTTRSKKK